MVDDADEFPNSDALRSGTDADFRIGGSGGRFFLTPMSKEAWQHTETHMKRDVTRYAGSIVVEPRFVEGVIGRLRDNGFTINKE